MYTALLVPAMPRAMIVIGPYALGREQNTNVALQTYTTQIFFGANLFEEMVSRYAAACEELAHMLIFSKLSRRRIMLAGALFKC